MFEELTDEAYELLVDILKHENEEDYWKNRFDGVSNREDAILRGCFKELREKNMVSVNWADNIPYYIQVLKDGYLYEKRKREIDEKSSGEKRKMKAYELLLSKLIEKADKDGYVMIYEYKQGENILFKKLEDEKLISQVSFQGKRYVSLQITYEGLYYFDTNKTQYDKTSCMKKQIEYPKYEVFISHASKDKLDYVEQLKTILEKLNINIFYDKNSIKWGDNWKQQILDGVASSEFAIIVISENFFGREWTEKELNELLNRQNDSGQKIILPLLHNISVGQLEEKYPEVADIQAISTADHNIDEIALLFAEQLIKRLKEERG